MPELSRFYGIVVVMYYNDHEPPHVHARYGSVKGRFRIDNGEAIDGDMGSAARRMMREWILLHERELTANWTAARTHQPLQPIAPLE